MVVASLAKNLWWMLWSPILIAGILIIPGCANDADRIVGDWELDKAVVDYANGQTMTLTPPQATGKMTLTSGGKLTQRMIVAGTPVYGAGDYELLQDEHKIETTSDAGISAVMEYALGGDTLKTITDVSAYTETNYWTRK